MIITIFLSKVGSRSPVSEQRARLLRGSQVGFLIDDVFMFSDLLLVVKTEIFDDSSYNDIIKVISR